MCLLAPVPPAAQRVALDNMYREVRYLVATLPNTMTDYQWDIFNALLERAIAQFVRYIGGAEDFRASEIQFRFDQLLYAREFMAYGDIIEAKYRRLYRAAQLSRDPAIVARCLYYERALWSVDAFISVVNDGEAWAISSGLKTFRFQERLSAERSFLGKHTVMRKETKETESPIPPLVTTDIQRVLASTNELWFTLSEEETRYYRLLETYDTQRRIDEHQRGRQQAIPVREAVFTYLPLPPHTSRITVTGFEVTLDRIHSSYHGYFYDVQPPAGMRLFLTVGRGPHFFAQDAAGAFYYHHGSRWCCYDCAVLNNID